MIMIEDSATLGAALCAEDDWTSELGSNGQKGVLPSSLTRNPQGCEYKPGAKSSAWRGLVALACSQEIDARPSGEGFQNSSRRHRRRVSRRGITSASKGWAAPPSRRFICDEGGVPDVNLSLEGLFLLSTPSAILREGWTYTGPPG